MEILIDLDTTGRHERNKNMDPERKSARDAILELLADLPEVVGMYAIGVPLVAGGYEQDELVRVLFALEREGRIEILAANGLRQKK